MTHEEVQQLIKETVAHAKNVWGSEESNIASVVLAKIEPTIKDSMDKNFNGKMGRLDQKLTDYIDGDIKWKEKLEIALEKREERISILERGKIQIWTAVSLLLVLGGAVVTLSIMAIDTKIQKGFSSPEVKTIIKQSVEQALLENVTIQPYNGN